MLPRLIIAKLRNGQVVQPEIFDCVTVMFADLYGFTELALLKTPAELTEFLDTVYLSFDPVLCNFDVYKVETICSIYMVASGVPVCNGLGHVQEICSLALSLRAAFATAPDATQGVFFMTGVHSGSCAAGVMGQKNPRYCLFGDTVNTASRMGSHSLPNKIHLSSVSAELLKLFSGFCVAERGLMLIKGKGSQMTFWLDD